ncbi:MAG: HNH endonuclease signature motif containing protein [Pirellulales bacterium]
MDAATRDLARQRASSRCEYCHFPAHALDLPFHVEHIVATVHRPDNRETNLAWACPRCNLRKGPNLSTINIDTGELVELFNPRTMQWSDHFELQAGVIVGKTACGEGTARLLDMNHPQRLQHRRQLIEQGEFQE